jgi:predicted nucleic acid-binding protein
LSLYVDTSALLKRYVLEGDSADCERILASDTDWITARHTWVEVLRNLHRLLTGSERARIEGIFRSDWSRMAIVELDKETCENAADLAKAHTVRTLDALHLAAALRVGAVAFPFVTYDVRQAAAARKLGMVVLGS